MVTVARLESGICKDPRFAPASVNLVFFVLSASETGLLLVMKLGRNVVMMRAGVKIMHQSNARRPENSRVKKKNNLQYICGKATSIYNNSIVTAEIAFGLIIIIFQ